MFKLRELESNQRPPGSEPGVTTNSNYPAVFVEPRQRALIEVPGRSTPSGNRTRSASFKGSRRDYAPERVSCGSRTRLARLEAWSLCRSAKDTSCFKRKVRESNPQGREARPGSSGVPSPVGLTFRKAAEAGIEPASKRLTVALPCQHRTHRTIQSGWLDLNQRSRAPEARGMPGFPTP